MSWIIDAHIHLSERRNDMLRTYAKRNGLEYSMSELLGLMESNGIAQGLLLSSVARGGIPFPSGDALALCRGTRGKLHPVITVGPTGEKVLEALRIVRANRERVKALKVMLGYGAARASDPVFDPMLRYAESEGLPVMFHTGDTADSGGSLTDSHPLNLDSLANKWKGLTIIACHFGNPWIDDVAELVYKHPNVFADLSGMAVGGSKYDRQYTKSLAEKLSRAIYFAGGADKVLFGSDYPVSHPSSAVSLVAELEIDSKDKRKVLAGNARRVFGI